MPCSSDRSHFGSSGLRVTGGRMGCGSWDAAARRRWAKVARIGYAIRQARRNRARVPHLEDRQLQSADTSDSLPVESKFQADAVGVDTAPAASKTSALPCVGRSLPPSRSNLRSGSAGLLRRFSTSKRKMATVQRSLLSGCVSGGSKSGNARRGGWPAPWTSTRPFGIVALLGGLSWSAT